MQQQINDKLGFCTLNLTTWVHMLIYIENYTHATIHATPNGTIIYAIYY